MHKTEISPQLLAYGCDLLKTEGQWYTVRLEKYRKYAKLVASQVNRSLKSLESPPELANFEPAYQGHLLTLAKAGSDLVTSEEAMAATAKQIGKFDQLAGFVTDLRAEGARADVGGLVEKWFKGAAATK